MGFNSVTHFLRKLLNINYAQNVIPTDYKCDGCGARGVKLWREYQTFADHTKLFCADCAGKDQKKDTSDIDKKGLRTDQHGFKTDQIGWYMPAIPVEGDDTYWGYTSIPQEGVDWWEHLPTKPTTQQAVQ